MSSKIKVRYYIVRLSAPLMAAKAASFTLLVWADDRMITIDVTPFDCHCCTLQDRTKVTSTSATNAKMRSVVKRRLALLITLILSEMQPFK